jgi:hypothetical protein
MPRTGSRGTARPANPYPQSKGDTTRESRGLQQQDCLPVQAYQLLQDPQFHINSGGKDARGPNPSRCNEKISFCNRATDDDATNSWRPLHAGDSFPFFVERSFSHWNPAAPAQEVASSSHTRCLAAEELRKRKRRKLTRLNRKWHPLFAFFLYRTSFYCITP